MKEKILQALKTKYNNLGLSEKAFDGVATFLSTSITEESQIANSVEGAEVLLKIVQSESDSLRGAKATAEKQLKELNEKLNALSGGQQQQQQNDEEIPQWAKMMMEENKKLNDAILSMKGEKISESRKATIAEMVKDIPDSLKSLKNQYERIDYGKMSNEEFEKLTSEMKTDIDNISATIKANGAKFGVPPVGGKGGQNTATDKEVSELVSTMKV